MGDGVGLGAGVGVGTGLAVGAGVGVSTGVGAGTGLGVGAGVGASRKQSLSALDDARLLLPEGQSVHGTPEATCSLYLPAAHAAISLPLPVYPASARQTELPSEPELEPTSLPELAGHAVQT